MQHRIFIAISVPLDVREKLLGYKGDFSSPLLKWQSQVNLHATLAFLGNIDDATLGIVKEATKSVASKTNKFVQKISYIGVYPKHRPTMVWAIGKEAFELSDLVFRVRGSLAERMINIDNYHYFSFHITLATAKNVLKEKDIKEISVVPNQLFEVSSIEIIESTPSKDYSLYKVIEKVPFGADANRKIGKQEPIEYFLGSAPFLNTTIDLRYHPLIPRPETAFWTQHLIDAAPKEKPLNILDVFAGSGCIGVAILKNIDSARVDFAEIDKDFAQQIKINLIKNHIDSKRWQVYVSDVFSGVKKRQYDIIVGNPPYIDEDNEAIVQKSVVAYEPREALFAPDNGLFFIKKAIKQAGGFLKEAGAMYVECDPSQKEEIEKFSKKYFKKCVFLKDQFDKWRVAVLSLPKK